MERHGIIFLKGINCKNITFIGGEMKIRQANGLPYQRIITSSHSNLLHFVCCIF